MKVKLQPTVEARSFVPPPLLDGWVILWPREFDATARSRKVAELWGQPSLAGGSLYALSFALIWVADRSTAMPSKAGLSKEARTDQSRTIGLVHDGSLPTGGLPLRCVASNDRGGQLLIPADGQLNVPDALAREQIPDDTLIRIWLPTSGLVALEAQHATTVTDCIAAPRRHDEASTWQSPPQVWTPGTRVTEFGLLPDPNPTSFLEQVRQELIRDGDAIDGMIPDLDSSGASLRSRAASSFLAAMRRWMRGKPTPHDSNANDLEPGDRSAETRSGAGHASADDVFGRLAAKIRRVISAPLAAAMNLAMQQQRGEQIDRLLKMFERDPDRALQYAIPMGGDSSWRGFAIPGADLMRRMTDYSASVLSGGGPVDWWSLPPDVESRLRSKYREQANRELAAGRFRRAAYVLAHLLQDFRGAAQALERGKHYVEAAEIYGQKSDKRSAARCLHAGGRNREAAKVYEALQDEVTAAEVYRQAGLPDEATAVLRRGYGRLIAKDEVVAAAKIQYEHLDEPEQAIESLLSQWPNGSDSVAAAKQAIKWLGECGRHDETLQTISALERRTDDHQQLDWARVTVAACQSYPSLDVRRSADDITRLSLAAVLAEPDGPRRNEALSLMRQLAQGDRQLIHDTHHYRERVQPKVRPEAWPRPTRKVRFISPDEIRIPQRCTIIDAVVVKSRRYLLVQSGHLLNIIEVLGSPDDVFLQVTRAAPIEDSPHRTWIHGATQLDDRTTTIWVMASVARRIKKATQKTVHAPTPTMALRPREDRVASELTEDGASASVTVETSQSGDAIYTLRLQGGVTHDLSEAVRERSDDDFPMELTDPALFPTRLALMGGVSFISIGRHLLQYSGVVRPLQKLPAPITAMAASMKGARPRLAVASACGVHVYFPDLSECRQCSEEAHYFDCVWLSGGWLVAARENYLDVFHASPTHPESFVKAGEQFDRRIQAGKLLRWTPASVALLCECEKILVWRLA